MGSWTSGAGQLEQSEGCGVVQGYSGPHAAELVPRCLDEGNSDAAVVFCRVLTFRGMARSAW